MNKPKIFFNYILDYGINNFDHFSRFKRISDKENVLQFKNVSRGIDIRIIMENDGIRFLILARMPKKISINNLTKIYEEYNSEKSKKGRIKMTWMEVPSNSNKDTASLFFDYPVERTEITFKNYIRILCVNMNQIIELVKSTGE